MKRLALFGLLASVAVGLAGCGGGGGPVGGGGGSVTYTIENQTPFSVPAGACQVLSGPVSIGYGSMHYWIDDLAPGTNDAIEAAILPNSTYQQAGCGFYQSETVADDSFVGSFDNGGPIVAGTYDFLVQCNNTYADCVFDLTWTATY